jgi:hypothetical protein
MKYFIFIFMSLAGSAQTINFSGKLLDAVSNKPIVFANLSFLKTNLGISSLEDGTFNLEIAEKLLKGKVHISSLNYSDTVVFVEKLQQKTLYLKPISFLLDEVVVSRKVSTERTIGEVKKSKVKIVISGTTDAPFTVARYFKFKKEYKNTPYLKNITIFLSKYDKRKAKFKVRIYSKDSITGFPNEDLIKDNLIVSVGKKEQQIVLETSKYDIEIPKNGIFISLERLNIPYNTYEDVYKYEDSISEKVTRVAPDFGGFPVFNEKRYSFKKGIWHAAEKGVIYYKGKTIVPAISLTLSN